MDCECMRMVFEMGIDKAIFGNGHNPQCEHFCMTKLWLYEVDCGEVDTVLANGFIEALRLANECGCNCEMDTEADEVTVTRIPIDRIVSGGFNSDGGSQVRFVDAITQDRTPRVLCSTVW